MRTRGSILFLQELDQSRDVCIASSHVSALDQWSRGGECRPMPGCQVSNHGQPLKEEEEKALAISGFSDFERKHDM